RVSVANEHSQMFPAAFLEELRKDWQPLGSTYADPSALLRLYVHQPGSTAMSAWRARAKGALAATHHGRVEIVNGICLAAFRKLITMEALSDAMASFEEGFYIQADLLWRAALRRASDLSRKHTPALGCWS